jgi:hypothetical protein
MSTAIAIPILPDMSMDSYDAGVNNRLKGWSLRQPHTTLHPPSRHLLAQRTSFQSSPEWLKLKLFDPRRNL